MKILLACSAGTSTSLVVAALQKFWKTNGILDNTVDAFGVAEAQMIAKEYDVILLGPQVRHMLGQAQNWVEGKDIPVDVMEPRHYALAKAEEIWAHIKRLKKI